MGAGLGHAALLDDGEQDVQVAQPDQPADPAVPIERFCHQYSLISLSQNNASPFSRLGQFFNPSWPHPLPQLATKADTVRPTRADNGLPTTPEEVCHAWGEVLASKSCHQ